MTTKTKSKKSPAKIQAAKVTLNGKSVDAKAVDAGHPSGLSNGLRAAIASDAKAAEPAKSTADTTIKPNQAAAYGPKPLPSPSGIDKQGHDGKSNGNGKSTIEHRQTPQIPAPNGSTPMGMKALPAPAKSVESEPADEVKGWLPINLAAIEAATVVAPKKDVRYYLNGAFIHRAETGDVRLISTDGHRLLAQTLDITPEQVAEHKWLDKGVILSRELIERCKVLPGDAAYLQFDTNTKRITLRDQFSDVTLKGSAIDGTYPDYQKVVTAAGASLNSTEREPGDATCFDSKYIGEAHKLAGIFGVKHIATYPGDGKSASVITFPKHGNALYIVMPIQAGAGEALPTGAARIIGASGLSRTLAALKAHATRHDQAAKAAKSDKEKEHEKNEAERFRERIRQLQGANEKALPAPSAKPADKSKDEAQKMPKMVSVLGAGFKTTAPADCKPSIN